VNVTSCGRQNAQIINPVTKRYSKEKYVSSFVGFVPADNPRLAMIVVV
jgi:cell division protein FtsI (penicillin-binding protein 3)